MSKIKIPFMGLKAKRICLENLDLKAKTFLLSYGYDICRISEDSYNEDITGVINKFQLLILDVKKRPLNYRSPEVFHI